jgi:hypothetical protein
MSPSRLFVEIPFLPSRHSKVRSPNVKIPFALFLPGALRTTIVCIGFALVRIVFCFIGKDADFWPQETALLGKHSKSVPDHGLSHFPDSVHARLRFSVIDFQKTIFHHKHCALHSLESGPTY